MEALSSSFIIPSRVEEPSPARHPPTRSLIKVPTSQHGCPRIEHNFKALRISTCEKRPTVYRSRSRFQALNRDISYGGEGEHGASSASGFSLIPDKGSARFELSKSMCLNERGSDIPGFDTDTALKYKEDTPEQFIDGQLKSYPSMESVVEKPGGDMHDHGEVAPQQRKGAKIHDFCLGIPFGGLVFGGGLVGFLFLRNPANLVTGMLSGGAILALGFFSLKVWRQGMSSLPYILGQAAIAATLLWKHFQMYSLTKKPFPSGFYVLLCAAMLCFYSYVLISGGNPPPKKKLATPTSS